MIFGFRVRSYKTSLLFTARALAALALLFFAGCGGGIDGTNPNPGGKVQINGTMVSPDGNAAEPTTISVFDAQTLVEQSTVSLADGKFTLQVFATFDQSLEVLFEAFQYSEILAVPVPQGTTIIELMVLRDDPNQDFSIIQSIPNAPVESGDPLRNDNDSSDSAARDGNSGSKKESPGDNTEEPAPAPAPPDGGGGGSAPTPTSTPGPDSDPLGNNKHKGSGPPAPDDLTVDQGDTIDWPHGGSDWSDIVFDDPPQGGSKVPDRKRPQPL